LFLYQFNGKYSEFSHCNSTWTFDHIVKTWGNPSTKKLLYPPCATKLYAPEKVTQEKSGNVIVSFAQFRPEKDHKLQIEIFKKVKELYKLQNLQFYIIGSVRGEEDQKLFDNLNQIVKSYNLENEIIFKKNLRTEEVKQLFSIAKVGIHTMKDEHFGISIIEMMAAGLITIAHKSAGPLKDIIGPAKDCVGLLAECKKIHYKLSIG
jgi:alpha-1,2-mannosyltransferase